MDATKAVDLLVVDDDEDFRSALEQRFTHAGFHVQQAGSAAEALDVVQRRDFDVAVVDMMMPGMSGLELLQKFKQGHAECEVIMLTGQGTIETAVEAMKLGAYDYLTKPFPLKDLERVIEKARERHDLRKENLQLRTLLDINRPKEEMVGRSPPMIEIFRLIERAGPSDKAILIQGESGTGKELVARSLHAHSKRATKPLVVINCAALPESLLESELFGHEKGAFTGAVATKQGLFEVADGGTLFIDEIGEMSGSLQAKLLRVLEDGSMRRLGSIKQRRVKVRLLAATNCNLAEAVKQGTFREDLYYRINIMSLELPPLRERNGDISLLLDHFSGPGWEIEEEARQALEAYDWPGNIRQLSNGVERAKIMADEYVLRLSDFPRETTERKARTPSDSISDDLSEIERAKVVEVLRRERGNKTRTARKLGIDRRKLYRLMEKYRIERSEIGELPMSSHHPHVTSEP